MKVATSLENILTNQDIKRNDSNLYLIIDISTFKPLNIEPSPRDNNVLARSYLKKELKHKPRIKKQTNYEKVTNREAIRKGNKSSRKPLDYSTLHSPLEKRKQSESLISKILVC